jgi:hypothetical protein
MGFVLSIIYLVVSYLTPDALFGFFAHFHIQLVIGILTLGASVPWILKKRILRMPQTLALLGLVFTAFLSTYLTEHWLTGSVSVFVELISAIVGFFFISLNFNTKRRIQILILALLAVCLIFIQRGAADLSSVSVGSGPPIKDQSELDIDKWNARYPYLSTMRNATGEWIYRIRGLGIINDPNDFAQLLVCVMPLMFIFWRPKKRLHNTLLVILPVLILVSGVFLTHSRGALLAMTVVTAVAAQRRVGTVPAAILAGCVFLGGMALQFSGGRDVSPTAGEDRTALWGEGLAAFRTHPLFGVGYNNLPSYTDSHLTAHNTIVVCASELGIVGFYFWSVFLLATFKDALATSSPSKVAEGYIPQNEKDPLPHRALSAEPISKGEINRMGFCVLLSLVGYLAAGWFLSRALIVTLFLLGGLATAVFQMAHDRGMVPPRTSLWKILFQSVGLAAGLLTVVYVVIRSLNFIR